MKKIDIIECDFSNQEHLRAIGELTAAYMSDPMGGNEIMPAEVKERLPKVLAAHPAREVFFAKVDDKFVGIITCFINISTFYARPYYNIHDVAVLPEYRNLGIGERLINKVIEKAKNQNFCKITLEVRHDNFPAQHLYNKLGFEDTTPPMYFWTRWLQ
jgi:ribosomal protein S18 acetylase RimI-like enzyme